MADQATQKRPQVLLGLTGSVATVKWCKLVKELSVFADVRIVCTSTGEHFRGLAQRYDPSGWAEVDQEGFLQGKPLLWKDSDEWSSYLDVKSDPVHHIDLRTWADAIVIAPCSANTMAKVAGGQADNLLTCVLRAWPFTEPRKVLFGLFHMPTRISKPIVLAPAMNTAMWSHPATGKQLAVLSGWGCTVVPPVVKTLACGDTGTGAMAEPSVIAQAVREELDGTAARRRTREWLWRGAVDIGLGTGLALATLLVAGVVVAVLDEEVYSSWGVVRVKAPSWPGLAKVRL